MIAFTWQTFLVGWFATSATLITIWCGTHIIDAYRRHPAKPPLIGEWGLGLYNEDDD